MKPCKTKRCKNQVPDLQRFCIDCKREHKRKQNKRWRKNNPDYNKVYLRSWKKYIRFLRKQNKERKLKRLSMLAA